MCDFLAVMANKDTYNVTNFHLSFYASANAICSHVKYAPEITVLFLLETFCLPLLSYDACEALSFSKQLEIRSVEHGICPIAEFTSPLLSCAAILAIRP